MVEAISVSRFRAAVAAYASTSRRSTCSASAALPVASISSM
jgi:hypothetical protein